MSMTGYCCALPTLTYSIATARVNKPIRLTAHLLFCLQITTSDSRGMRFFITDTATWLHPRLCFYALRLRSLTDSSLIVVMYGALNVGGKLSEQVAQNPNPRFQGVATQAWVVVAQNPNPRLCGNALVALDNWIGAVRLPHGCQCRPAKRSCVEKYLRSQGFFIAPVGHEVADDSVLDALANTRAIAAKVIPGLPTGHRVPNGGKRVLHQELRIASSHPLGETLWVLWPSRWGIPRLIADREQDSLDVDAGRCEALTHIQMPAIGIA